MAEHSLQNSSFSQGKVILSGEHSVVHGQLAILASIGMGIEADISDGELSESYKRDVYLQHILQIFCEFSGLEREKLQFSLSIKADLPQKSGMGSSAVFACAVLSELAKFYQISLDREQLYQLVLEAENFAHGHSSGADPAIVVYGGLIAFAKGKITQLTPSILASTNFFLIDSGAASESTGEMIAQVAQLHDNQDLISQIGSLTHDMLNDLQNNSFKPSLLSKNQLLLEKLGVVGAKAQDMIRQLQAWGADCKITGAGGVKTGSGYILAYHPDTQALINKLQINNWSYFSTQLGLRKESL